LIITILSIHSLHAQKSITTDQLVDSFKAQYDSKAVDATLSDFQLGTIDMTNASAQIVVNRDNETSRYATAPIYLGTTLNAVLLGLYDNNARMHYWIVQVTSSSHEVLITYYRPGQGKETIVQILDNILTKIDDYSLPNTAGDVSRSPSGGSCVGNAYRACQAHCTGSCATSCAFWNDWFGSLCNKAMWVGAVATCAGLPAPGGPCGGF